jgi:hypothetical protein
VNLRLETTRVSRASRDNRATAGVEVLAFGTGLELRRPIRSRSGRAADGRAKSLRLPDERHQHEPRPPAARSSRCSWEACSAP